MKQSMAIALAGLAALTLTSCNRTPSGPDVSETETPEAEVAESASKTEADQSEATLQTQPFTTADGVLVSEASGETQLPGLIPSTDPSLRVKAVGQGRQDPFGGRVVLVRPLPPDPQVIDDTNFVLPAGSGVPAQGFAVGSAGAAAGGATSGRGAASAAGAGPSRAATNSPASRGSGAGSSTASRGRPGTSGTASAPSSGTSSSPNSAGSPGSSAPRQVAAGPSNLPDLTPRPPIPDPTLAQAVEVTGVIQIGSGYQAIVKAPDEPTSRYVTVGQRLSNGRILVKRIESNGSEPVVILEEQGVEVVRAVGAPAAGSEAQAAAALPMPSANI